ncbi:hypothetical protein [Gordonia malaquae]|nr:hypothetical protein [Gordonia malaquae]
MRSRLSGTSIITVSTAVVAAMLLTSCGSSEPADPGSDLPSRLLPGDSVPQGFTVVPQSVGELIAANRSTLESASTVGFVPAECKPTADAKFNPQLTEDNTVLLVAQSETGTFSELLTTVRRDVDADRRDTSGPCASVTATPSTGSLAGIPIVNTSVELPALRGDDIVVSYLVRTDSVKRPAGANPRSRTALLANVLVKRPGGQVVTIQMGVSGTEVEVTPEVAAGAVPGAPLTQPPLDEAAFTDLVKAAVERAAAE